MLPTRALAAGLTASLSIGIGYLPIAFSFALAAVQAGLPQGLVMLISVVVYAGASQFALIALLTSGGTALGTLLTVLLMNARHVFYGPTVLTKLVQDRATLPAPLLAFGLTDEVFATAMGKLDAVPAEGRELWYLGLQLGAYAAWLAGTLLGVVLGLEMAQQSPLLREMLGFILPALFFALLLEMSGRSSVAVVLVAGVTAAVALQFLPGHVAISVGILAGAGAGLLQRRGDEEGAS